MGQWLLVAHLTCSMLLWNHTLSRQLRKLLGVRLCVTVTHDTHPTPSCLRNTVELVRDLTTINASQALSRRTTILTSCALLCG